MDRRSSIKSWLAITAGVVLFPSCLGDKKKPSLVLTHLDVDSDRERNLADLAETLIPRTGSPGAKDISAHLFALKMVNDCYDEQAQLRFIRGLGQFEAVALNRTGQSFAECTPAQKRELVKFMETGDEMPEDAVSFYHIMKKHTLQAFVTSKFFLTQVHIYELAPSRFHGCVAVN